MHGIMSVSASFARGLIPVILQQLAVPGNTLQKLRAVSF